MAESRRLLRELLGEHLDPGYRTAAARRDGRPAGGAAQLVWLVCGTLLIGLVLGAAASDAAARAPGAEQARRGLMADVRDARARTDSLAGQAADLGAQRDAAQSEALASDQQGRAALDELARLEQAAAAVAVTGPGLRITVDAQPAEQQAVFDRDLQVLVNSLWVAGAEAVAFSGVRLHPRATIRHAGGAVLVDNHPVSQPYLLAAIGDPARLQIRFVETDGYGRFATFAQIYGIQFVIEPAELLRLPAGSPAEPVLATGGGNR